MSKGLKLNKKKKKGYLKEMMLIVGIVLFIYSCSTQYKFYRFFAFWSKEEPSHEQIEMVDKKETRDSNLSKSQPINNKETKVQTSPSVEKVSTKKSVQKRSEIVKVKESTPSKTESNQRVVSKPKTSKPRKIEIAQAIPEEKVTDPRRRGTEPKGRKAKEVFPCNPIYLSARGVCAGTGDPEGRAGEADREGRSDHPQALELSGLPKDRYGFVDWAESIRRGLVKPRNSINPNPKKRRRAERKKPMDLNILIRSKSRFQPHVIFPHKIHTMWLNCQTCHPKIFRRRAGGNPEMTMPKIASGEYCGRCHNRIAFPLSDCLRCHTVPQEIAD